MNETKAKEWKENIKNYRSSGLTAKRWAEKNKKSVHKLRYWITQFNKEQNKKRNEKAAQQWISVPLNQKNKQKSSINLKIGSVSIEVTSGFDKDVLSDVLSVVQGHVK